jgi:hypothetical protein
MKKRGLGSPDCADALALTFALPAVDVRRDINDYNHFSNQAQQFEAVL